MSAPNEPLHALTVPGPQGFRLWTASVLSAIAEEECRWTPPRYTLLPRALRPAFAAAVRKRLARRAANHTHRRPLIPIT